MNTTGRPRQRPKKSLGQHFLTDIETCKTVVRDANILPGSRVLEVGPGRGFLTRTLLEAEAHVVAVEKDRELIPHLQNRFPDAPLELIEGDFLDVDLEKLGPFDAVVGNLPYNLGLAIVSKCCKHWPLWKRAVFMLQLEVVERICAKPNTKAYGVPSVVVASTHVAQLTRRVGPGSFVPRPKVHSALVRLIPKNPPLVDGMERESFLNFVGDAFRFRRKTSLNAVSRAVDRPGAELKADFNGVGMDPQRRLETCSVEELLNLWNAVKTDPIQ